MPEPGQNLSHYRLIEKIGEGGMGVVWKAEDTKLGRQVALKLLSAEMTADPGRRERFEREARAVAALNHPNIVTIHSVEKDEGVDFLTMEFVEGETLSDRIPRAGMPLSDFFDVAIPLADALAAAHQQGITHRDLKPDNVMVTREGRVKVLDFGLAKLREPVSGQHAGATQIGTATFTDEGKIVGTVHYMSPEQAEGKPVDHRSDVFSLGIVLYQMATGEQPFRGDTPLATLSSILKDTPEPVTANKTALPRHLGRVVHRCMEKSPDRRYQTALDVRNELEQLRTEVTSGDSADAIAAPARKSKFGLFAGIAAAALVLVAGAWFIGSRTGPSPSPSSPADAANPAIGVIGFENLSDAEDSDQLGRMLMGLVSTDLAETGGLQVVSSSKVLAARRAAGIESGGFDASLATEAARKAGVDIMLVGQVMQSGDRLMLTAELVDVSTGNTLDSVKREGPGGELFALAGSIAEDVRDHFDATGLTDTGVAFDLARSLTESAEAYRHYVTGERSLHRLRESEAVASFERAVDADPTFAWAWYQLAVSHSWDGDLDAMEEAFERGLEFIDRLPARWQIVYRAEVDSQTGNYEPAHAALTELLRTSSDIPDAHYNLGEIKTHSQRFLDPRGARQHFERALDIDPSFKIVYYHLWQLYIDQNDLSALDRLISRFRNDDPDDSIVDQLEVVRLYAVGRYAEAIEWAESNLSDEEFYENEAVQASLYETGQWERLSRLTDWNVESGEMEVTTALSVRAVIRTWSGGLGAAIRDNILAAEESRGYGVDGQTVAHTRRARLQLWLANLPAAEEAGREAIEANPHSSMPRFVLARVLFAADRLDEGRAVVADLTAVVERNESPRARCWLQLVRAEEQLALGDTARAGRELDALDPDDCFENPEVERNFLRGRVLEAAGDVPGAIAAYRSVTDPRDPWLPIWLTPRIPALYEVARLEDRQGNVDAAREYYRRYLDHWGNADVPIPQVAVAKARLAELAR